MSLDFENITNTFIDVVRGAVGHRLSADGPTGVEYPSVVASRPNAPIPDPPYVEVDISQTADTDAWMLGEGITADGQYFLESSVKLRINFYVYGPDALSIAHDLKMAFRFERVLNEVLVNTGGEVESVSDVISNPVTLPTGVGDSAALELTFNTIDRQEDTLTGIYHTINLDGEVLRDVEDDDPIQLDIFKTSQ